MERWRGLGECPEFKELTPEVPRNVGYALHFAQRGDKHPTSKPLKGFSGAGVLEIVEDHDGETYRAVYKVRFEEAVYVLHVFQKKSKHGIAAPRKDLDLIEHRLALAEQRHQQEVGE